MNVNGREGCQGRNRYTTAEQLFEAIDKRLKTEQNPGVQDKTTSWLVEFDPEMGYPKSLDIMPVPNAPEYIITSTTTVRRINILRTITPGTPGTTITP